MDHPIQGLMKTAMESLKGMVDVNTVVGDAVETPDGTVIIPVSRVSLGFVAGGGEYGAGERGPGPEAVEVRRAGGGPGSEGGRDWPFGGGSGAGVSVCPLGFLIASQQTVRFLPVDQRATLERILDATPDLIERLQAVWRRDGRSSREGGPEGAGDGDRDGAAAGASPHRSGFEDLDEFDDV